MAKNHIFSNDAEQLINELLRELQGLDRRIKNLKKAAAEASKFGVKPVEGIEDLQASGIKKADLRAMSFEQQVTISMLRSAIQSAKEQLASIDSKKVKIMKKYTKIEKEFEADKIITGHAPISGAAGHDRYTAIMDTLSKSQRDERRHGDAGSVNEKGYDSGTFFDIFELAVGNGLTIPEVEKMIESGEIDDLTFL